MVDKILFWLSRKINYPLVSPQVAQVSLTYRCNLRCRMCSIAGLLPKEEELSTKQIFHIIDEARDYNIKEILFTGGEPFLREDIFEICEYANKKPLRSIITTNGTIIEDRIIDKIIKSKISHIHISLDGLEATNDFFRGAGTFNKILYFINTLNTKKTDNNHFSIGIACTVMDENVKELLDIVQLADNLGIDVINFQPLTSDNANFLEKKLPLFWVRQENLPVLAEEIIKIRQYKSKHVNIYEEPHLELLLKYYDGSLTNKDWVCFGGFKTAFVCYDKKQPLVYSCHGVSGNLDNISLKSAWTSKEAYKLRLHSKKCKQLCMQSCYSHESCQNIFKLAFKK